MGYSRESIQRRVSELMREGSTQRQSIAIALCEARAAYFKRYPQGALPMYLAWQGHRLKKDYDATGQFVPMSDYARVYESRAHGRKNEPINNPVRELPITPRERERIRDEVSNKLSRYGAEVRAAARLYSDFTGHEDISIKKVKIPVLPGTMLQIGEIDGILYSTVRDGVPEKYIHEFKKKSRPLFCVSPDGKNIYIVGGRYDFTERGIVDR